ncbi:MAG: hypothetical protein M0R76_05505 [Proteobacteria bacterium]|nr:hypothetical protein [Pseudomonadota bacterium]
MLDFFFLLAQSHSESTDVLSGALGHHPSCERRLCGFAGAFLQLFDPGPGGAWIVLRDVLTDFQEISPRPVSPENLHGFNKTSWVRGTEGIVEVLRQCGIVVQPSGKGIC